MYWHKVTISAAESDADQIEEHLWESGALSVTLTDPLDAPIYEPGPGETPLWAAVDICGLYEQDQDITAIVARFESEGLNVSQVETMAERVWEREWLTQFEPMPFGPRLWIVPTEYEVPSAAEVALRLDPGLAFGTGTHATTALILEWLDRQTWQQQSVLDYGAGSGVLGIAALLLGASSCRAVDTDPQSITATNENAVLNKVDQHIVATLPEAFEPAQYDVVLANILAAPLVTLAQNLMDCLAKDGMLVLSGIMSSQQFMVEQAYEGRVRFVDQFERDGWVCLVAKLC